MISDDLLKRIISHFLIAWAGATIALAAIVSVICGTGIANGDGYVSVYAPDLIITFLECFALWVVGIEGALFWIKVCSPVQDHEQNDGEI